MIGTVDQTIEAALKAVMKERVKSFSLTVTFLPQVYLTTKQREREMGSSCKANSGVNEPCTSAGLQYAVRMDQR